MADFRTAFPDFHEADMPKIPEGFVDASWRNDACPSFWNSDARLTLWVDYAEPALSEIFQNVANPDGSPDVYERFALYAADANGMMEGDPLFITNDWPMMLAFIEGQMGAR